MVVKPNKSGGAYAKSGYTDLQDHGLIGNCRTAALISISGTIASMCLPHFDSPSVFARILDKNHGGHFSIRPTNETSSKQQYVPSTNVLSTKFLSDEGVGEVHDFMPMTRKASFLPWLVRSVTVLRGKLEFTMECAPAFDYARASHETSISQQDQTASFKCPEHLDLDLRWVSEGATGDDAEPKIVVDTLDLSERGHKGLGVTSLFTLEEGQTVTFVLREPPASASAPEEGEETPTRRWHRHYYATDVIPSLENEPRLTAQLVEKLQDETVSYWLGWIKQSCYEGRWRETVQRSALALKLLTFLPTGAIVAAPTFSLPEDLEGAGRNWDYRYSWLRDSSFSVYALLRIGLTQEADAYVEWLSDILTNKNSDGSLQIMYTLHGGREIDEEELTHFDGHKGQKPVRIGNGAANHLQLDIYGEVMDAIYLAQKMGKPLSYSMWLKVRALVDYVCTAWDQPDLSIWEVRGARQDFLYSKIMCWVAIDRGLRLAEKRSLPCPSRSKWYVERDRIYEEIMDRGYNKELGLFSQSYQAADVLDSAVLVMPLCFFIAPNDPTFISTLKKIMRPRDKGGLVENGLCYRYDTAKVDDGTGGGEEGAFTMCTLWLIEALSRAGKYEPSLEGLATPLLEDLMGYANHLGLLSEEISKSGQGLGNLPQAFSHVALISACFNVDRGHR